jgi:hypothetical protein
MKTIFYILICVFNINVCLAQATEKQELLAVVKSFDESIKNKDKERFLDLFIEKGVSWVGVFSEKNMVARTALIEKYNKTNNKSLPISRTFLSSPQEFIEAIVAKEAPSSEEFSNIKIHSDNNVATIYFDYEYYSDNKRENWGAESWQLVQTTKGWKIHAVSFSINTD